MRYRVTRPLAEGGMAEVFLGVAEGEEGFEKPVALKRLHPHMSREPEVVRMFLAEANIGRHLHHQNILEVLDVGRGRDGIFLVMEAVDGWNLRHLLRLARDRQRPFPPELAAWIIAQVNAGLLHAYSKRVGERTLVTAHRDVSDSNILVSREGEVKIGDFGVARMGTVEGGTTPGTFKGRMAYAAPELLSGLPASPASDQFALGVLLCELTTGVRPWGAVGDFSTYLQRVRTEPPRLEGVADGLRSILERMISVDVTLRFTPADLSRGLGQYLATIGRSAGPHELAHFIHSLGPPPSALEIGTPIGGAQKPADLAWFELEKAPAQEEDWWDAAPGPVLDVSGRIERLMPAHRDPPVALGEEPPPTRQERSLPALPPPEPPREEAQPLELARDIRREEPPPTAWDPPPDERPRTRRSSGGALFAVGIVAALVGAGWYFGPGLWRDARRHLPIPQAEAAILQVDSRPSGARVRVGDAELGFTPLRMDNFWPEGRQVEVVVELEGHAPWKGSFEGGRPQKLEAQLKPGRAGKRSR